MTKITLDDFVGAFPDFVGQLPPYLGLSEWKHDLGITSGGIASWNPKGASGSLISYSEGYLLNGYNGLMNGASPYSV